MQEKILLLLIEDDELISMALADTLEVAGFAVELAKNGKAAVAILEAKQGSIGGVMTDIELGKGADGWEIARRARELIAEVPVVYMSGTHQGEWTSHGVPNSIFVGKPYAPVQIVTAISTLLNMYGTGQSG